MQKNIQFFFTAIILKFVEFESVPSFWGLLYTQHHGLFCSSSRQFSKSRDFGAFRGFDQVLSYVHHHADTKKRYYVVIFIHLDHFLTINSIQILSPTGLFQEVLIDFSSRKIVCLSCCSLLVMDMGRGISISIARLVGYKYCPLYMFALRGWALS